MKTKKKTKKKQELCRFTKLFRVPSFNFTKKKTKANCILAIKLYNYLTSLGGAVSVLANATTLLFTAVDKLLFY